MTFGAAAGGATYLYYVTTDTATQFELMSRAGPILRALTDAETAHRVGIMAAKAGMMPKETRPDPASLRTKVWGRSFANPVGLAAGFDKDAEVVEPMLSLGFGFVEVGSITPQPQPGNPKPRVFRLPELKAIVNRYGFNSLGADAAEETIAAYREKLRTEPATKRGVLGINLGKNKTSSNAAQDYCIGLTKLAKYADYLVINISSPNTPGLRALQVRGWLWLAVSAHLAHSPRPAPYLCAHSGGHRCPRLAQTPLRARARQQRRQPSQGAFPRLPNVLCPSRSHARSIPPPSL